MKIKEITEHKIIFDNGTTITQYHEQNCCEWVYADFMALKDSLLMDMEIDKLEFEEVKGAGVRINGHFLPCYDIQNGYYSNNLELIITSPNGEVEKIDLTNYVKSDYDN